MTWSDFLLAREHRAAAVLLRLHTAEVIDLRHVDLTPLREIVEGWFTIGVDTPCPADTETAEHTWPITEWGVTPDRCTECGEVYANG